MLTRKDFKVIAETIKNLDLKFDDPDDLRDSIASEFARMLRRSSGNPNFDIDRFIAAATEGK